MEIIKIYNGSNAIATSLHLTDSERASIKATIEILRNFESIAKDPRDVFEFKYSQKFLKMLSELDDVESLTQSIDELMLDEELIGEISNLESDMTYDDAQAVTEIIQSINDFMQQFAVTEKQPPKSKSQKNKKPSKKIDDKFEQLAIDFPDEESKGDENQ